MIEPTPRQAEIRDHEDLDLVVVAPAGCGKTEALALRVQGLLARGAVTPPTRILVTTFSNRARDNIRTRLRSYLSAGAIHNRVTVANFHGLSARIFRAHAATIGRDPEMEIPESDWVREQCQRIGLDFPSQNAVQETLRIAKQKPADDAAVEQELIASGITAALQIERQRLAENRLTYDDLPRLAELILHNPAVSQLYRNHFAAVVVDEFQDLTPQQLRIVNAFGYQKTTYAGDLAQGIYGFAGADPAHVDAQIRAECTTTIEFAESHRSSPAVLRVVNALATLTGGQVLTCAKPDSWPSGGLAGGLAFASVAGEAKFAIDFARYVLERAPNQRIGIIARTGPRRRFVDEMIEGSGLEFHRWDDPVLDTDTAKAVRGMLSRLDLAVCWAAPDPLAYLRDRALFDSVQDPSSRASLGEALSWCLDLLRDNCSPAEIRGRVRVGDEHTLLSVAGVHLLTGHVGKGQQFDWVIVIGAEDGCIPDFRAKTPSELTEEARILSVMVSRARHGVLVCYSQAVPSQAGRVFGKSASRFWTTMASGGLGGANEINNWLDGADWSAIAVR
jgi:DNA helicase-2/ATP-dependent DNA helicase PcrA